MQYETFGDGLAAGIRVDAPSPILMLWPALLLPLSDALIEYATFDQLQCLRMAAAEHPDTPSAVLDVIDAYIALYTALQKL